MAYWNSLVKSSCDLVGGALTEAHLGAHLNGIRFRRRCERFELRIPN